MTGYDTRGARFPLTITRGADLAFELTVTDSLAAAVNLSAATIAGEIYTTAGVLAATMGDAVSGAGSNIVTLTMTDAATELLTDSRYNWTLWVTRGANTAAWLAGDVYVGDGTTGQSGSTSGSQALTVDGDLSVSVTVSAVGYDVDSAALLASIKTVDGAGSGLDADLLDGNSSAYFATATGLSDHIADTTDAHDASAISVADAGLNFTATDVEAALAETVSKFAPIGSRSEFSTAAQRAFRGRLQAGAGPAVINVLGDSTGNWTDEWPSLLTLDLAAAHPEWNVLYRVFNDTPQTYGSGAWVRQVATAGMAYLTYSSGGYTTADSAAKSITTSDLMIRARLRATDLDAATERSIANHYGSAGNRGWRCWIDGSGLKFEFSEDGTTLKSSTIMSAAQLNAAFDDDVDFYIGVQVTRNSGGSARVEAITSTTNGQTWVATGTAVTSHAAITTFHNSTQAPAVGERLGGSGWAGRIYYVEVLSGLTDDSGVAWRFEPGLYKTGSTFVDGDGNTWTANNGVITQPAPTLLVSNGSVAGATISYAEDVTRQPKLIGAPANLTIINYGHNESSTTLQTIYKALITDVLTAWPSSGIAVVRQNPQHTGATDYTRQNRNMSDVGELAAREGYGVIDAFQAFLDTGEPDTYVDTNDVHPNTAGKLIFGEAAAATFDVAA